MLSHFEPFAVGGMLIRKLLSPSLDGKIFLRIGDFRLAWLSVLRDEEAGKPRKVEIFDLPRRPAPQLDHFVGLSEMVLGSVTGSPTGRYGFFYRVAEVPPVVVAQLDHQLPGAPVRRAVLVDTPDRIKNARSTNGF